MIFYPSAVAHLCPSCQIQYIKDLARTFTLFLNTFSLCLLCLSSFISPSFPSSLYFFFLRAQSPPKTIITSLVMQLADRLILQKELNPTAQNQQIILSAKPGFPFWNNALIYTRVTLKLVKEKAERRDRWKERQRQTSASSALRMIFKRGHRILEV